MNRLGWAIAALIGAALIFMPDSVAETSTYRLDVSCGKNDKGVSVCRLPEEQLDKLLAYATAATAQIEKLETEAAKCKKGKWT